MSRTGVHKNRTQKEVQFCPFDGTQLLAKSKYCQQCQSPVNVQVKAPRKPRNFYEKMPDGLPDNYTDDLFLQGLHHKCKSAFTHPLLDSRLIDSLTFIETHRLTPTLL